VGSVEVGAADRDRPPAHGDQRRLVEQVLEVRAAHPRRAAGERVEVGVDGQPLATGVHREDRPALLEARQRDDDLAVEASGAKQRRVEHVGPVRRREHDDPLVAFEAVHLREDLVEGLLTLVVTAAEAGAPLPPDGVDLVDEHDRRPVRTRTAEEVAHPCRPDADEHLHELRARDRDERRAGLACDRPREEGLARARRADEEDPLRDPSADVAERGRAAQELDDLAHLLLHRVVAGHVGKARLRVLGDLHPRAAL
jgi:hypothetical protein